MFLFWCAPKHSKEISEQFQFNKIPKSTEHSIKQLKYKYHKSSFLWQRKNSVHTRTESIQKIYTQTWHLLDNQRRVKMYNKGNRRRNVIKSVKYLCHQNPPLSLPRATHSVPCIQTNTTIQQKALFPSKNDTFRNGAP